MARKFAALTLATLFAALSCRVRAPRTVVTVESRDFPGPTKAAVKIINGYVGCGFLEYKSGGAEISVEGDDGAPCGLPFHPGIESGHSAVAYACPRTNPRYQVRISLPGDIHTQACIVAHELGHALGLQDGGRGIMNQRTCPERIRLSDLETDTLRRRYCD